MPDKLSGLYLTTSHAIKINSPVTFEIVPIMLHNHVVESTPTVQTSDVHYLWVFGDEVSRNLISLIYYNNDASRLFCYSPIKKIWISFDHYFVFYLNLDEFQFS